MDGMIGAADDLAQAYENATLVLDDAIAAGAAHWARTRPGARRTALWQGLGRLMQARAALESRETGLPVAAPSRPALDRLTRIARLHEDLAPRLLTASGWLAALPDLQDSAQDIEATLRTASGWPGSRP